MKPKQLKISAILIVLLILTVKPNFSQVLISNSEGNPDNSAMLEIKSSDKGLLIPRVTTEKRNMITPVAGLLVFDSDFGSFFLYGKTAEGSPGWIDLSTDAGIWTRTDNDVYLSNTAYNVGIGTKTPTKKLVIKAENNTDTLMEIQDQNGYPLMVITPQLTKFNFIKSKSGKASGISGGFAVGRYATAKNGKALTDTALFLVTSDSARIYTSGATGISGGFAVGRYATAKGKNYVKKSFFTNFDSTRVYTDGSGTKGISGGFAVGRYATAKGTTQNYNFFTDVDSTRVFTGGATGISGGFAVGRYATAKGSNNNYMYMVPDNYFIGHQAGDSLQNSTYTGKYNLFCGFESGISDTSGSNNSFFGYRTGYNNTAGNDNTFIGDSSGFGNTSGSSNLFVGKNSGISNTSGSYNSFMGYNSGHSNITGYSNSFLGSFSGENNTTGSYNTFVGFRSGNSNTEGSNNNFLGAYTGANNTTGANNIFVGPYSGYKNKDGDFNIFMGYRAGYNTDTANYNVFIGYQSGYQNTSSSYNVFIGYKCGFNNSNGGITGDQGNYNTFLGFQSGMLNTSGRSNVFLGCEAGYRNNTGNDNIFIGDSAGYNTNAADNNIFIGHQTGLYNSAGTTNIFLGDQAGSNNTTGNDNIFIGYKTGLRNSSANSNIFIGNYSGWNNSYGGITGDEGKYNVFIGQSTGQQNKTGYKNVYIGYTAGFYNETGNSNVFIGDQTGYYNTYGEKNIFLGTESGRWNSTGSYNVFMGYQSGGVNTEGSYNVFMGFESGAANKTGDVNVFMGCKAGRNNTTGTGNVFIGDSAGYCNKTAGSNVFIGTQSGFYSNLLTTIGDEGQYNAFLGYQSGWTNFKGYSNVFLGNRTGYRNNTGNNNVFIGDSTGFSNTNGYQNVFIGDLSGFSTSVGYGNVFIGSSAGYNETGSEKLYIENSSSSTPLIYGDFANDSVKIFRWLNVNDAYTFPSSDGNANEVMITDGNGNVTWSSSASSDNDWTVSGSDMYSAVAGNVGIGTNPPNYKLDVDGTINARSSDAFRLRQSTYGAILRNDNANFWLLMTNSGDPDGTWNSLRPFRAELANGNVTIANIMKVEHNGNVGIGTSLPGANLDIAYSGSPSMFLRTTAGSGADATFRIEGARTTGSTSDLAQIEFYNNESGGEFQMAEISTRNADGTSGTSNSDLLFKVNNGSSLIEAMRIDHAGSLGIGTSSPAQKLDVNGNIRLSGGSRIIEAINGEGYLDIRPNGTTYGLILRDYTGNSTIWSSFRTVDAATDYLHISTGNTSTSEGLIISANGNVGVGVTTPAYRLTLDNTTVERGISVYSHPSSGNAEGVYASSYGSGANYAIRGYTSLSYGTSRRAIWGSVGSTTGNYAGYFDGNVHISGTTTKAADAIKIDHPNDPENKYLYMPTVTSSEMLNIYNGNVIMDENGEAVVTMPDWCEDINTDIRYQLTAIGTPGPNLYIKKELNGNQFVIAGGVPGMKVSWMLSGTRNDPFAKEHRIKTEEDKPSNEKGTYMHPELYGQPVEKWIDYNKEIKE